MTIVTVHEAKTNLSKLLKRVEAGEEIVIARGKVPVARLQAITKVKSGWDSIHGIYRMDNPEPPVPFGSPDCPYRAMSEEELEEMFGKDWLSWSS